MAYDLMNLVTTRHLKKASQQAKSAIDGKVDSNNLTHETLTFELEDGTAVNKEIVLWTSQA